MSRLRMMLAVVAVAVSGTSTPAAADDAVVNTPQVISALRGAWELQPAVKGDYQQRLTLDGQTGGHWQKSKEALPTSITFYVEGNELLLQYYYETNGVNNYRVKQLRFDYKLDGETLSLTRDGVTGTWKRITKP